MNIFVLTLVVCLLDPTAAVRLRENLNVLVPSNDVNLHAKIKKLLNGAEVDSKDLSDNEIENLSEMRNPKIEKLIHKGRSVENKIFDDKNKNIEDNQIERDVVVLSPQEADSMDFSAESFQGNSERFSTVNSATNVTSSVMPTTLSLINISSTVNDTTPASTSTMSATWTEANETTTTNFTYSPSTPFMTSPSTIDLNGYFTPTIAPTTPNTTFAPTTPTFTETTPNTTISVPPSFPSTETTSPTVPTDPPPNLSTEIGDLIYDDTQADECLFGKSDRDLKWVGVDGRFIENQIHLELGFVRKADLSRFFNSTKVYANLSCNITQLELLHPNITDLKLLSVAFNNLNRLPYELLTISNVTLEFLSLAGNDFSDRDGNFNFPSLPALKELDWRNCQLKVFKKSFLSKLGNLQYLYLAKNHIADLLEKPFPSTLVYLDLSSNVENVTIPDGLKMIDGVFGNLKNLQTLDFSNTKIDTKCSTVLLNLPKNLVELSLCYAELLATSATFLKGSTKIQNLDISGNPRLILNEQTFSTLAQSLQVLYVRSSNVRNLDWTAPLKNLKLFDLYDNNIHTVTNKSFSHMSNLLKLNLEKNTIGNWYDRLFAQNQKLEILNLRENKLTKLTNDMHEDLSSVEMLAIGNNDFECSCVLQEFMHKLFEATKNANITAIKRVPDAELNDISDESGESEEKPTTRVSLGLRSYTRPEYDVISRTYQKYYKMVELSIEALKIRLKNKPSPRSLQNFVMRSTVERYRDEIGFQTLLFDYDEDNDDYQCMNATAKGKQTIIDMHELCETSPPPPYTNNTLTTLSISIPAVLIVSVLLVVAYWKWWYIKYFFVLCKNSAILTFMDDSDGGKEAIVKGGKDDSLETYLYDVFVSYSDQNREWVLDEFIPNVEKRESINVCLHERDFQVGYGILENIVSCMDRSRCLLLLISENFLLSQWCQFEMNLAQHRLLETRREKLILVLLEDIEPRKQPKTLKYLMRTKTYIKWPGGGSADEKQLFWKRLKKSIISSKWETESYGTVV